MKHRALKDAELLLDKLVECKNLIDSHVNEKDKLYE